MKIKIKNQISFYQSQSQSQSRWNKKSFKWNEEIDVHERASSFFVTSKYSKPQTRIFINKISLLVIFFTKSKEEENYSL